MLKTPHAFTHTPTRWCNPIRTQPLFVCVCVCASQTPCHQIQNVEVFTTSVLNGFFFFFFYFKPESNAITKNKKNKLVTMDFQWNPARGQWPLTSLYWQSDTKYLNCPKSITHCSLSDWNAIISAGLFPLSRVKSNEQINHFDEYLTKSHVRKSPTTN